MSFVSFIRRSHDDTAPGALTSDDWLLDANGELNSIEPQLLAKPQFGERSCCCAGPPQVRVILAVPGSATRMVDILLCHHHYRLSQERLTELGAMCVNAPAAARNVPSPIDRLPDPRERA